MRNVPTSMRRAGHSLRSGSRGTSRWMGCVRLADLFHERAGAAFL